MTNNMLTTCQPFCGLFEIGNRKTKNKYIRRKKAWSTELRKTWDCIRKNNNTQNK